MTDREFLDSLGLKTVDAAKILGVPFQALYRAMPSRTVGAGGRRGKTELARQGKITPKKYLTVGRLLIIWRHFIDKGKHDLADVVRKEIVRQSPDVGEKLGHFRRRIESGQFTFTEIWIFSKRPFELDPSNPGGGMREHLINEKRKLVYFVPSRAVAKNLLSTLSAASDEKLQEVYIVVTTSVLLSPHWAVVFDPPGGEKVFAGVPPRGPKGTPTWTDWEELPDTDFQSARDTLSGAGLLDGRGRFKLPQRDRVGGGEFPEFEIFFPEIK